MELAAANLEYRVAAASHGRPQKEVLNAGYWVFTGVFAKDGELGKGGKKKCLPAAVMSFDQGFAQPGVWTNQAPSFSSGRS